MKVKNLLAALLLSFCTTITFAQQGKSFKTITVNAVKDTAFDKIIDYLQAKDIFIESVDKQAGFIKGKTFLKYNKMLSAKAGERRTMSFILRPADNNTNVTLSIYSEVYKFGGNTSSRSYYYEDNGIMDDVAVYQDILSDLQQATSQ